VVILLFNCGEGNKKMPTKPKILLVDDEKAIIEQLTPVLELEGFYVVKASDGEEALRQVKSFSPDLIVLDVFLPLKNGREVLRDLRQAKNWTPVILLTKAGGAAERTRALEEGADDYLNKPYDAYELIARIRAVLRRARPGYPPLAAARRLVSNELILDRVAHRAWLRSKEGEEKKELPLTPKAIALLEYLMTHPDELLKRERLLDTLWDWDQEIGTRAVDARIHELRQALRDNPGQPRYIESVPGQGYRFVAKVRGEEFP
jgi:DNA-binding response OmpR family regulator